MRSSLSALPASLLLLVAAATAPLALAQDPASESGLKIEHTKPISCSRPSRKGDKIAVNYIGTLESTGVEFDQSYKRGVPFEFRLGAGQVIAGWDLGLLAMCPGEKRKLTIPPELGYGERNMGIIPPHSTLVFETELVEIVGVQQGTLEKISSPIVAISSAVDEGAFSIATAPATPPTTTESDDKDGLAATPLEPETAGNLSPQQEEEQPECQLLGPFALFVQAALGAVAISSLVVKRYRETPKRPWKIFTFDVSKQVLGSMLTHVLNLAMSMFSTVDLIAAVATAASQAKADDGRVPNPCSYYLLNLGIDTTIGIPVLYLLLKVLHRLFLLTPLASPPQSIKSGHYGTPPHTLWWLKQLLIYFLGLVGMKLFVFFLFAAMPWLPWIGDWALRWTDGSEALQITFTMFIFPVIMNAAQYLIIDGLIMERKAKGGEEGYERVGDGGEEEEGGSGSEEQGSVTVVGEEVVGKDVDTGSPSLADANPTPVPVGRGEGTRSPLKGDADENLRRR